MRTAQLLAGCALMAAAAVGPAAAASAGPPTEVLCERVGGGEVPTDLVFGYWGCELTSAPGSGKDRLIQVADMTKACPRENFVSIEFNLGGGLRAFLICLAP